MLSLMFSVMRSHCSKFVTLFWKSARSKYSSLRISNIFSAVRWPLSMRTLMRRTASDCFSISVTFGAFPQGPVVEFFLEHSHCFVFLTSFWVEFPGLPEPPSQFNAGDTLCWLWGCMWLIACKVRYLYVAEKGYCYAERMFVKTIKNPKMFFTEQVLSRIGQLESRHRKLQIFLSEIHT